MLTAALFATAKIRKQPRCTWTYLNGWMDVYMNGQRRGDWYTKNELLSHKERIKMLAICSIMDGLGEYYARWNKSDRERQILYDISYMWNIKNTTN